MDYLELVISKSEVLLETAHRSIKGYVSYPFDFLCFCLIGIIIGYFYDILFSKSLVRVYSNSYKRNTDLETLSTTIKKIKDLSAMQTSSPKNDVNDGVLDKAEQVESRLDSVREKLESNTIETLEYLETIRNFQEEYIK